MGAKHPVRSPAKKREDELQELLHMTRQALFKRIRKELDLYRVTQFQDGKSGGKHLAEEPEAAPDAEIEFALIDQRAEELRRFDLAVERLRAGAYGICEDCGKEISAARLKALPSAARCTRCQERCETASPRMEERRPLLAAYDRISGSEH